MIMSDKIIDVIEEISTIDNIILIILTINSYKKRNLNIVDYSSFNL